MTADRLTEEADWKDGMNIFRSRVIDQLDGILEVLDILEKEIATLNQNNKENTP